MNELKDKSYFRYWGKADLKYQGEPKWHPLVYHCLDVAAVGAAWWDKSPAVRRAFITAFGCSEKELDLLRSWILFFIVLHDLGKFDVRFQLKAIEALKLCWPDFNIETVDATSETVTKYDHGKYGYAWIKQELCSWLNIAEDSQNILDAWQPWVSAVTGHHGELPDYSRVYPPEAEDDYVAEHDKKARRDWIDHVSRMFLFPIGITLKQSPPVCSKVAQALLAGFCSIADWIGSNATEDAFRYRSLRDNPIEYLDNQVKTVTSRDVLRKFGLVKNTLTYAGLPALLEEGCSSRGVQTLIDKLPAVPGFTLIEAPTGSGKTEAALAYAWRLLEAGCADSIIFALPTQATANAMLTRATEFAEKAFGEGGANLVLAHGKRDFSLTFRALVEAGRNFTVQGKEAASVQCAAWLAQSRKRVFLGQIGICTVDQVLLSVLPVRHKFVRGFAINKSVLIVDEVHAYDSYMHGLLGETLSRQKVTGGSAILLSATLPPSIRRKLVETWDCSDVGSEAYPLITHISLSKLLPLELPDELLPARREVSIECLSLPNAFPDKALIQRIVAAAEAGARIAVILNLVNDAQRLAKLLPDTIPVDVFHARYRFEDRQFKEEAAKEKYGKTRYDRGGRVLVATQVVEQSLDFDFDWMVTQICPVDLLFQRLGRLHRHERERPIGFQDARCTVMTMPNEQYGLHSKIYGNVRALWRTEKLLRNAEKNIVVFPYAYRAWINAVYEGIPLDNNSFEEEPDHIFGEYLAYKAIEDDRAIEAKRLTTINMTQFRDEDVQVSSLTRDGEMSLTVVPVLIGNRFLDGTMFKKLDDYKLAEELNFNSVHVPASWEGYLRDCRKDEDGRLFLELVADGEKCWITRKGKTTFRYSGEFGLERE